MLDRTGQVTRTKETAIFNGTEFARAEIALAIGELIERANLLKANLQTLNENFTLQRMSAIKLASENISAVAGDAKKNAAQIEALSASLAQVFLTHINRRPRIKE